MNKDSDEFLYLESKFSRINELKFKEDIFISPQIIKIMQDSSSEATLNSVEKEAYSSFKVDTTNFLVSVKAENYGSVITEMPDTFRNWAAVSP